MSKIIPFPALLPNADCAERVACPPYDVVTTAEARALAKDKPESLLHITRPEIDLDHDVEVYDEETFWTAKANLSRFQMQGWLKRDDPSLYVYRITSGAHAQTGIVAGVSAAEYETGLIRRHEKTRMGKEDERTELALALRAHLEPVLYVHRRSQRIAQLIAREVEAAALIDITDGDGVRHTLWRIKRTDEMVAAFSDISALYIADGHHRSAAGARVREKMRANDPNPSEENASNFFPAVIFPDDEVHVYQYDWDGPPEDRPLAPITMADIIEISDRGEILPPKSTWFAPKLSSGLFVYTF